MSLINCRECNHPMSNTAKFCFNCGYSPTGKCSMCQHYEKLSGFSCGRCNACKDDYVRKDKNACPAFILNSEYFFK